MNKFSLSALTIMVGYTLSFSANIPVQNNNKPTQPIEIISLSQIPEIGKKIDIKVTRKTYKSKSFFSSFLSNNESEWMHKVKIDVDLYHCFSNEHLQILENNGYAFKSRNADGLVIGFREALQILKDDGAKYILLGSQELTENDLQWYIEKNYKRPSNSIQHGKPFNELFLSLLTNQFPHDMRYGSTFLDIDTGAIMAWNDRCQPMSTSGIFSILGQVASLGLGLAGAKAGNTGMTSLAANSNNAFSSYKPSVVGSNGSKESGIARKVFVQMYGVIDPMYFDKQMKDMGVKGYLFPIEEIEQHLTQYNVLSY